MCENVTNAFDIIIGLQNYYYNPDGFWSMCGQTGFNCKCDTIGKCFNCYRWNTAVILETIVDFEILFNDYTYRKLPDIILSNTPYTTNLKKGFVDDCLWFVLAYIRVYEWLGDFKYLEYAKNLFDYCYNLGTKCDGWYWTFPITPEMSPISISNTQGCLASAKLAMLTQDDKYLNISIATWNFIHKGMIAENGLVSNGLIGNCCDTNCKNDNGPGYTYNQGLYIASSAYLYILTQETDYLDKGEKLLIACMDILQNNGILSEVPEHPGYDPGCAVNTGVECDCSSRKCCVDSVTKKCFKPSGCSTNPDTGGDWFSFKGIFMRSLPIFLKLRPNARCSQFIMDTCNGIWKNAKVNGIDDRNVCSDNKLSLSYPKFAPKWDSPPGIRYCADSRSQCSALSAFVCLLQTTPFINCTHPSLPPLPTKIQCGWIYILFMIVMFLILVVILISSLKK
jgi:predicted alpha-1,6-mannanase (GH76 family)